MRSYLKLPGPRMIFIEGGTYEMGERGALLGGVFFGGTSGDLVTVGDFLMDETPVTVAQYREAVNAGAVGVPFRHEQSNWYIEGRDDHPINCVNWYQAKAYADWAGKRLPSEEEWEWAARGGDEGRAYPWGGAEHPPSDQLCWNGPDNDLGVVILLGTSPVGSYPKGDSKHGLKDMAGNVDEWTNSIYSRESADKVIRGGSWGSSSPESHLTGTRRSYCGGRYQFTGFRCVVSH